MSPPTPGKQPNGHATRAVITAERRIAIWAQVYNMATKPPICGKWCTRDELVEASLPPKKTGPRYNVDELTEVMRGKKHKKALGVESSKVDGEWLYRFSKPGAEMPPTFKLSPPAPVTPSSSTKRRTTARPPVTKKTSGATPSKPKAKATPSKAKRNTPLRPRPKSPRSASKSPVAVRASSRKRAAAAAEPPIETHLRPAVTKRPRLPSERRTSVGHVKEDTCGVGEGEGQGEGRAVGVGGAEGADGGGSWCTIM